MRKIHRSILKDYFHHQLVQRRSALHLTQSEMAEQLFMDDRSYIDLDHGKTCCNATTLAIYLVYICDDVCKFVEDLRHAFEVGKNSAA